MFLNSDIISVICEFLLDIQCKYINVDFYRYRDIIQKNIYNIDGIIIYRFEDVYNFISFMSRNTLDNIYEKLIIDDEPDIPGVHMAISKNNFELNTNQHKEIIIYPICMLLYKEVFDYIFKEFMLLKSGHYIYPTPVEIYVELIDDDEIIYYDCDILIKYLEHIYVKGATQTRQEIQQYCNKFTT